MQRGPPTPPPSSGGSWAPGVADHTQARQPQQNPELAGLNTLICQRVACADSAERQPFPGSLHQTRPNLLLLQRNCNGESRASWSSAGHLGAAEAEGFAQDLTPSLHVRRMPPGPPLPLTLDMLPPSKLLLPPSQDAGERNSRGRGPWCPAGARSHSGQVIHHLQICLPPVKGALKRGCPSQCCEDETSHAEESGNKPWLFLPLRLFHRSLYFVLTPERPVTAR